MITCFYSSRVPDAISVSNGLCLLYNFVVKNLRLQPCFVFLHISDEEAAYVDQLREYLYFCDALKTVFQKYQLRQFDLERAEETLKKVSLQTMAVHVSIILFS